MSRSKNVTKNIAGAIVVLMTLLMGTMSVYAETPPSTEHSKLLGNCGDGVVDAEERYPADGQDHVVTLTDPVTGELLCKRVIIDSRPKAVNFAPDPVAGVTVSKTVDGSGSKLGRLTLGAFVEGYAVADRQNTTHNGVVGAIFTIGAKHTWLEVGGGLGGGAHGIGWNLRGSVGLVFDLGQRLSFGLGAMTSRWRYDREIEGNATRYDRIMNGGYLALAYDFGPVEGRLSVSFGREGHETKTEVKSSWSVEYGRSLKACTTPSSRSAH
jgi:hypothetical protein